MDRPCSDRLAGLSAEAMEQPEQKHAAFCERHCGDDPELRRELLACRHFHRTSVGAMMP
ncbi:MAG: hypothetical protein IPK26_23305 [Planctomycetes bacterium]|nr:hypothetical protein [Planctomycetota bacterium]